MARKTEMTTVVDLIRHGEPVGGNKYRGQIDDPLSDKGWQQMRDAVSEHQPWQHIVSSSLVRCRAFAEELASRHGFPLEIEERFKEIGFGCWEGKTKQEVVAGEPDAIRLFLKDPIAHRPAGAEALSDFRDRVIPAWNEMLRRHAGKHLLVVGHAGLIRMIMRHVLEMPLASMYRIHVPNAGITRIKVTHDEHGITSDLVFHAGKIPVS